MDKLRHIHSKVGSETAYRIPVSVEDAIAEAVEAYDLMRMAAEAEAKRGDELAAKIALFMDLDYTHAMCRDDLRGIQIDIENEADALEGEVDD